MTCPAPVLTHVLGTLLDLRRSQALKAGVSVWLCLGMQDTQKQILEYAKEACTALGPNLHDQCLNYVELYGPLVVNMIVQVKSQPLCSEW